MELNSGAGRLGLRCTPASSLAGLRRQRSLTLARAQRRAIVAPREALGMVGTYLETYRRSLADPDSFWREAAQAIDWEKRWDRVLYDSTPPFKRWFSGGTLKTCYNALDRHYERSRADQLAQIYDSPVTGLRAGASAIASCATRLPDSPGRCEGSA